ncbi:PREDICTED: uncharacterized protein LOC104803841 [Tarenaya hassleriana]|uniref:uncharacterized protein LOC104803841 n=1 Tax=Tarenaya hassleriana TaxID=28532 RepID=UPI00053C576F|nr:PREDICTED: uncharacterized protein LOC104803841 [Tarenaya hassleriana]
MDVPRRSLAAALSPLRLIDGFPRRTSFSYDMIPEEPIKLHVLKLDGSSFDINVLKIATVRELKMAVEDAFSHIPNTGPGKVSWPHVWAQFCLCYEGHRLINETDYIAEFGIKDGNQLKFIRHISNHCFLTKKQAKTRISSPRHQPKLFSPTPKARRKKGGGFREDGGETITRIKPSFLATTVGGLISYGSMPGYRGTKHKSEVTSSSPKKRGFLKKMVMRFGFKCYSENDVWNRRLISQT